MFVKAASVTTLLVAAFSLSLPAAAKDTGAILVQQGGANASVVTVESGPTHRLVSAEPLVVRSPLVIDAMDRIHSVRARAPRHPEPPPSPDTAASADQPFVPPVAKPAKPAPTPVQAAPEADGDRSDDQRVDLAESRLFDAVPDDIESYFDLFMYVSKANRAPMGQRMFVFERDTNGKIVPYAEWRVSTGREQWEERKGRRTFTTTPEGVYRLDPDRFHREYFSRTYDNAPMPFAMFFDMRTRGYPTGLAIHAAASASKIARLGRRDSGGCVRLSPKHAKELFYKIQNTMSGMVPVFAETRGSTDRWGKVARDASGNIQLAEGYKALLMIEDFDGRGMIGPVVAYTH
jgi:lipoprotein-anchoring transpeptidase ErfK/SrfK